MAEVVFTPGKSVETRETEITVAAGLQPGNYTFQLVVEDNSGNVSAPATVRVTIAAPPPPPPPPQTGGTIRPDRINIRDGVFGGIGNRIVNR